MASHYKGTSAEVRALNVFINLFRAADTIGILLNRQLRKEGLTGAQFGVLETLYHLGPLEQHILAKKLLVSRGNITFIVDKLEQMQLISRVVMANDRRCNKVDLTIEGRKLISRIFPGQASFISGLIGVLDEKEQVALAGLLKKLGTKNNSNHKGTK